MSDIKYKTKKLVQNGVIRYAQVPFTAEDEIEEKDEQIKNLKSLCDNQRQQIELLEEACRLHKQIMERSNGELSSTDYDCYS